MVDYIGYILQGLFTGIGAAIGLYIHERYLKPRLEKAHENISSVITTKTNTEDILNKMLNNGKENN